MENSKVYNFFVRFILFIVLNAENIKFISNSVLNDDSSSKYLNNFERFTNASIEVTEYYDAEEPSISPDVIYPDPRLIANVKVRQNDNGNKKLASSVSGRQAKKAAPAPAVDVAKADNGETVQNDNENTITEDIRNEDLKEHDIIDSIMYIYYGSNVTLKKNLGGSVIIVGTVFALAAQILAVVFFLLRNRRRTNYLATITLHLLLVLCASNLVFIIGVQATKNILKCEVIAVFLHYLHLSTSIWGLCHTFSIYDYIINESVPDLKYHILTAYGSSAVFVLFSFAITSSSYEIYEYCWMSVQRGMIINFMIPASIFIVVTTILGTLTLRAVITKQRQVIVESIGNILEKCQNIEACNSNMTTSVNNVSEGVSTSRCCDEIERTYDNDLRRTDFYESKFDLNALSLADLSLQSSSDSQDYSEFKRAIKFSVFFQPAFSVCWFLGVIALENRHSCVMPIIFIICYNILSWYVLYQSPFISPLIFLIHGDNETTIRKCNKSNANEIGSNFSIHNENSMKSTCTDKIPLLCSVTAVNRSGSSNDADGAAGGTDDGYTDAVGSVKQDCGASKSMIDDFYNKPSVSGINNNKHWGDSIESINLECISTISN